ncbi:hypothetical protein D3C87_1233210 [compost metagenome]
MRDLPPSPEPPVAPDLFGQSIVIDRGGCPHKCVSGGPDASDAGFVPRNREEDLDLWRIVAATAA